MTAICPAGPPKVCREMANQARAAERNGTTSAEAGAGAGVAGANGSRSAVVEWSSELGVTTGLLRGGRQASDRPNRSAHRS